MNEIRRGLVAAFVVAAMLSSGCGTIVARTGIEGRPYRGKVYPAVRSDAECIKACMTGSTILHSGDCDNAGVVLPIIGYTIVPLCFVVDIPISAVTDTVLIPVDLLTPTREEESEASNHTSDGIRQPADGSPKPSR